MTQETKPIVVYTLMFFLLIFGTFNTQVIKAQDNYVVYPDEPIDTSKYNHPYFQCMNMFFGDLLCGVVYFFLRKTTKSKEEVQKPILNEDEDEEVVMPLMVIQDSENQIENAPSANLFLFAIPAAFDFCGSTLMMLGLTRCSASIYQMMRGLIVVITAALARIFLDRKQYGHHYLSLAMIVTAIFIVGVSGIMNSKEDWMGVAETEGNGVVLILLAQIFSACQFVIEEKLIIQENLDPLLCVGLEGFWGCLYFAIMLPIFQVTVCDESRNIFCHYNPAKNTPDLIEDSKEAWNHIMNDGQLFILTLGIILSQSLYDGFGVALTKHSSAAQRSTIDTSRTVLIWILNLMFGKDQFMSIQFIGYVILVFGTLIYNEILILPFECLNKDTKSVRSLDSARSNRNDGSIESTLSQK